MSETKSTSMRLSEATREELKKFVSEHKFATQDEAVQFLLSAATFTQAAKDLPLRQQTLTDISYHMSRIMDLIQGLFKSYSDTVAKHKRQLTEKDALYTAEKEALMTELRRYQEKEDTAEMAPAADSGGAGGKEPPPANTPAEPLESPQETAPPINVVK